MAQQGGKRAGAGRPKGAKDKATREAGATISELARAHVATALNTLVSIAKSGESEAARVSAANAILDRGFGRPPQAIDHQSSDGSMSPKPPIVVSADPQEAARQYERLMRGEA